MDFLYFTAAFLLLGGSLSVIGIHRLRAGLLPAGVFVCAISALALVYLLFLLGALLPASFVIPTLRDTAQIFFSVMIFEAGRRLIFSQESRWPWLLTYTPGTVLFLLLVFVQGFTAPSAATLAFGFPGCAMVARGLWRVAAQPGPARRVAIGLRFTAVGVAGLGLFLLLHLGEVGLNPLLVFYYWSQTIYALLLLLVCLTISLGAWIAVCGLLKEQDLLEGKIPWLQAICRRRTFTSLFVVFIVGAIFTDVLGRREASQRRESLFQQITLLGDQLDTELHHLTALPETGADPQIIQSLDVRLRRWLLSMGQAEGIFMADKKPSGEVVSLGEVRSAGFDLSRPQGTIIPTEHLAACWDEVWRGHSCLSHPKLIGDQMWVSALVPVPHPHREGFVALSVDFPAEFWFQGLKQGRLVGIFATILILLLLLAAVVTWHLYHSVDQGLRSTRQRLELALAATDIATWEWDLERQQLRTDGRWAELLGLQTGEKILHLSDFYEKLGMAESAELQALVREHLRGKSEGIQFEFPLQREQENSPEWMQIEGRVTRRDAENHPRVISGTLRSVEKQRQMQKEIYRTREIYRTVVENLGEILYILDNKGRWTFLNSAWEKIIGGSIGQALGRPFQEWIHPDDRPTQEKIFQSLVNGTKTELRTTARYLCEGGNVRFMDITVRLLRDQEGRFSGAAGTIRDVTDERATKRIMQAVASLNSTLITLRLENEGWNEPLEILGQATEVDRVYIFRDHQDPVTGRHLMSQLAEWNSGDAQSQIDNPALQNVDYLDNGFGEWLEKLPAGKEINCRVAEMKSPAKELMLVQDITTILIMPIFVGEEYFGYIGYDECFTPREWQPGDLALLRSAAGAIGLRLARQRDEDNLKVATAMAEEKAEEAAAANKAKSAFLATMSHEIRTPLNAVIGMASLLQETSLSPLQTEYAGTVINASNTLLALINDVLDYSKIESGYLELAREEFSLEELIVEPLEILARTALEKGVLLSYFVARNAPKRLVGDKLRLKQVLLNLVSNGVKFTHEGEVSLSVECSAPQPRRWRLQFTIVDSGIGISPEVLPHLFQPFLQGDSSITRRFGGTGLGLVISRRLVNLMGGEIEVQSEEGRGTKFSFAIELPEAPGGGPQPQPEASALAEKTALLCFQSVFRRRLVTDILQFHGVQCSTVASLDEARSFLEKQPAVDFFLADYPGNGARTVPWLEQLRTFPGTVPPAKIFFNLPQDFLQAEAKRMPLVCLTSPVSSPHLVSCLHSILQQENPAPLVPLPASPLPSSPAGNGTGSPLRVLVAEDNPNNQKVIQLLLRKCGCSTVLVENGQLAVEAVEREPFDLVILDLQMPVMDGLTAVGEIRKILAPSKKTVLMALTANAFAEDREECLKMGFDLYAAKPISLPQLRVFLQQVAGHSS